MGRLLVHVEGVTEEAFVNELLMGRLQQCGYERVGARLLGNARQRYQRGGIRGWKTVKRDIIRHLKEDSGCIATTMVDYYALPQAGAKAWPGRAGAAALAVPLKAEHVEAELLADVTSEMGTSFDLRRFVPFVIMHEFEGLLFSDCNDFARGVGQTALAPRLQAIRDEFNTPEHINDSVVSAPSKRVEAIIPGYEKPLFGNLAALEIGLDKIVGACPHFRAWIADLEARAELIF
jgi:hypothetical protein